MIYPKTKRHLLTKLLVGVGNPGQEFYRQRHNIGFRAVDFVAEKLKIDFDYDKKKAIFGKKVFGETEVIVLKPQTFINLSGEAVLYIASFLRVDIDNVLVVFDDINSRFGLVKEKRDSGGIEHSAVKHMEISLNNRDFARVAFGIGPLLPKTSLEDFYLSHFTAKEEKQIPGLLKQLHKICLDFLDIPGT